MINELPICQLAARADNKLTARIDDVQDIDTTVVSANAAGLP